MNNNNELNGMIKTYFQDYGRECTPAFLAIWSEELNKQPIEFIKQAMRIARLKDPIRMMNAMDIVAIAIDLKYAHYKKSESQNRSPMINEIVKKFSDRNGSLSDKCKQECRLAFLRTKLHRFEGLQSTDAWTMELTQSLHDGLNTGMFGAVTKEDINILLK